MKPIGQVTDVPGVRQTALLSPEENRVMPTTHRRQWIIDAKYKRSSKRPLSADTLVVEAMPFDGAMRRNATTVDTGAGAVHGKQSLQTPAGLPQV